MPYNLEAIRAEARQLSGAGGGTATLDEVPYEEGSAENLSPLSPLSPKTSKSKYNLNAIRAASRELARTQKPPTPIEQEGRDLSRRLAAGQPTNLAPAPVTLGEKLAQAAKQIESGYEGGLGAAYATGRDLYNTARDFIHDPLAEMKIAGLPGIKPEPDGFPEFLQREAQEQALRSDPEQGLLSKVEQGLGQFGAMATFAPPGTPAPIQYGVPGALMAPKGERILGGIEAAALGKGADIIAKIPNLPGMVGRLASEVGRRTLGAGMMGGVAKLHGADLPEVAAQSLFGGVFQHGPERPGVGREADILARLRAESDRLDQAATEPMPPPIPPEGELPNVRKRKQQQAIEQAGSNDYPAQNVGAGQAGQGDVRQVPQDAGLLDRVIEKEIAHGTQEAGIPATQAGAVPGREIDQAGGSRPGQAAGATAPADRGIPDTGQTPGVLEPQKRTIEFSRSGPGVYRASGPDAEIARDVFRLRESTGQIGTNKAGETVATIEHGNLHFYKDDAAKAGYELVIHGEEPTMAPTERTGPSIAVRKRSTNHLGEWYDRAEGGNVWNQLAAMGGVRDYVEELRHAAERGGARNPRRVANPNGKWTLDDIREQLAEYGHIPQDAYPQDVLSYLEGAGSQRVFGNTPRAQKKLQKIEAEGQARDAAYELNEYKETGDRLTPEAYINLASAAQGVDPTPKTEIKVEDYPDGAQVQVQGEKFVIRTNPETERVELHDDVIIEVPLEGTIPVDKGSKRIKPKGQANAETVRGDQGQASEQGRPVESGENVSGEDIQLEAPQKPGNKEKQVEPKLPTELKGAKPRYSYGDRQFTVEFDSDVDKAAYIAAQATKSKRDDDYVAWGRKNTGLSESQLREHGAKVRAAMKKQVQEGRVYISETGNQLKVPRQPRKSDGRSFYTRNGWEIHFSRGSFELVNPHNNVSHYFGNKAEAERLAQKSPPPKGEGPTLYSLPHPEAIKRIGADVVEGAKQLYGHAKDFAQWSGEMIKRFGEKVKEHLQNLWEHVRSIHEAAYPAGKGDRGAVSIPGREPPYDLTKKGEIPTEREARGKEPMREQPVRGRQEAIESARQRGLPAQITKIAEEVKQNPRPITQDETAAMQIRMAEIENDSRRLQKEKSASSDIGEQKMKQAQIDANQEEFDTVWEGMRIGHLESGRGPAQIAKAMDEDFSLHNVLGRAREDKGKPLTPGEKEYFEKRVSELEKATEDLQAKLKRQEARGALASKNTERAKKLINETREALGEKPADGAEARVQDRLRKQIENLEKQIDEGVFEKPTPKAARQISEETARLRQEAQRLKKKAGLMAKIQELQNALETGNLPAVKKRAEPIDDEQARLEIKKRNLTTAIRWKREQLKRGFVGKTWNVVREPIDFMRALQTSMDVSAVLRQGGKMALAHPIVASKSIGPMLRAFASEKHAIRVEKEIEARDNWSLYHKGGLNFSDWIGNPNAREEMFMSRLAGKIPGIKGSNRAYVTFLNKLRADVFDKLIDSYGASPEIIKAASTVINDFTGRPTAGNAVSRGFDAMTPFFYAPRNLRGNLRTLALMPLWSAEGSMAKKLVAAQYARWIAGFSTVLALGVVAGGSVETNPVSAAFAKLKFDDRYMDFASGALQPAVFFTRMLKGQIKTADGKVIKARGESMESAIKRFLWSKASPGATLVHELATGLDYKGAPIEKSEAIKSKVTPLGIDDIIRAFRHEGMSPREAFLDILSLAGAGSQVYDDVQTKRKYKRPEKHVEYQGNRSVIGAP